MHTKAQIATATDAAHRIVELQNKLAAPTSTRLRDAMTAEQRALWDDFLLGYSYERVEALTRYN